MTEESTAVGGRPFIFENVWQVKDLQARFLDASQIKGVSRRNFVSVAGKGVMGFLRMSERLVGCRSAYRERRANHKEIRCILFSFACFRMTQRRFSNCIIPSS
jgi:hypothetical protein